MNGLFIHGKAKNAIGNDIVEVLNKLGHTAQIYSVQQMLIDMLDDECVGELEKEIREQKVDFLISIHFIMNAALAAYNTKIRYICILWDAPYLAIYNPLAKVKNVYISTFDQLDKERFIEYGMKNVLYQPLSVNESNMK